MPQLKIIAHFAHLMPKEPQRFSFNLASKSNGTLREQIAKIRELDPIAEKMSNSIIVGYLAGVGAKSELQRLQRTRKSGDQ